MRFDRPPDWLDTAACRSLIARHARYETAMAERPGLRID
jgi:hypothetical protein